MTPSSITAIAHANVALVKYFGKRNLPLNLPAAGSLSITLAPLMTETTVTLDSSLKNDLIYVDNKPPSPQFASRAISFLDLLRTIPGSSAVAEKDGPAKKGVCKAKIETSNNFPTAAGLASSASGFAALTMAATHAFGIDLTHNQRSALARRGSGSACRSLCDGIGIWQVGEKDDGSDSFAHSIAKPDDWDLRVVVGVTDPGPKKIGSTIAMEQTKKSSPYYQNWINSTQTVLGEATRAVAQKDFTKLGEITEHSALSMHAAAMAAKPGIVFFNGTTVEAIHLARELRENGTEVYFTCDAGPQPKLLCREPDVESIANALGSLPGITDIIRCKPGKGAHIVNSRS